MTNFVLTKNALFIHKNCIMENSDNKGFYKLNWLQRIGFGSGDLAQNLIYQTISIWLLFYYTNIFGINPGDASIMFLVVRLVDVLWDPVVGTFIDKHNPKLGKYRSYLVFAGIPLTGFAILCFWNGLAHCEYTYKLIYCYVTYVTLSMLYTLINVPYGALNSSLTRDTNEITILTSVRMFMANFGGLCVSAGVPVLVAYFNGMVTAKDIDTAIFMGLGSLPAFIFMPLVPAIKRALGKKGLLYSFLSIAIVGMAFLYVVAVMDSTRNNQTLINIAQFVKSSGVIVATGYMWALIPEVISYSEWKTGKRISGIVNALTGIFFKAGMALGGVIPGAVLWMVGYNVAEQAEQAAVIDDAVAASWFNAILIYSLTGLALLIFCFSQCKERVVMDSKEAENVKVSDLWLEFVKNRPLRVIAFFFITAFAMMSVGNAAGPYFKAEQANLALPEMQWQGILAILCVIPSILLLLAMFIISRYELDDARVDEINREIEARNKGNNI